MDGPDAALDALTALAAGSDQPESLTLDPQIVLLRYAPMALVDGCWLWGSVQVRQTDAALPLTLLDSLFLLSGEGDAAQHPAHTYRALLGALGVSLPPLSSSSFVDDPRFSDVDFALPLFALRTGMQTPPAWADVIGVHAAMMILGPPPIVRLAASQASSLSWLSRWDPSAKAHQRALDLVRKSLSLYGSQSNPDWPRVVSAAVQISALRKTFVDSLVPAMGSSPWSAMLALVEQKFRHGYGFHRDVRLGGRSMDLFFDPSKPDLEGFLQALSRSPWVSPGCPEQSLLLTRATQFGGSMFGVFDDKELATLSAWIAALPGSAQPDRDTKTAHADPVPQIASAAHAETETASFGTRSRLPSRDDPKVLYHQLLCHPEDPSWVEVARDHLLDKIAEVESEGHEAELRQRQLWPYSPHALSHWVDQQLREQVLGPVEHTAPLPAQPEMGIERHLRKQEVLWLLSQLAPAALIDGAWLQGVAAPLCGSYAAAPILLQIYRDELGAGFPHQHHGNIMRKVLADQGVHLPPCDSDDFVRFPMFAPESFSTPVLWLAISLHSREFFPELLGLNLAIELAGVGRAYDRASALLRKHGIDPYFFVLHNTIDNGASGHTAWSVRAIQIHLEQLRSTADDTVVAGVWQRVWRGYALYGKSSLPLLRAVGLRVGPRLGLRWAWRFLSGSPAAESA